jgi:hypothetical protein
MYQFYFKQGTEQIALPLAPAEFQTKIGNSNRTVQMMDIGEINILKNSGLREYTFTILLPGAPFGFLQEGGNWREPIFYLNQFVKYKSSKKPVSLIIFRKLADGSQLFDGNVEVSFEEYTVTEKAGEQGDFWVELRLKEYRKVAAEVYKAEYKQGELALKAAGVTREGKEIPKTYTVKAGDNLWNIAKKMMNDGNKCYEIAKANNISDPSKIYPGQVLRLEAIV